jgi:uncharacterized protein YjbI with pentapeptide repeats
MNEEIIIIQDEKNQEIDTVKESIKYIEPFLQEKTIVPTKEFQEVVSDDEYNGLSKVVVEPIPNEYLIPSGTRKITEEGEYDVTEYKKVDVEIVKIDGEETTLDTFTKIMTAERIFEQCSNLTKVVLSNINTPNLTTAQNMFYNCKNVTEALCNNWIAPSLKTISLMFQSCSNMTKVDFSGSSLTAVTGVNSMFYGCSNLIEADLSGIYISGNCNYARMFTNCKKLQKVDLRNCKLADVTTSSNWTSMFTSVPTSCEIIVMNDACKTWMNKNFSNMTNVKTVAELG